MKIRYEIEPSKKAIKDFKSSGRNYAIFHREKQRILNDIAASVVSYKDYHSMDNWQAKINNKTSYLREYIAAYTAIGELAKEEGTFDR